MSQNQQPTNLPPGIKPLVINGQQQAPAIPNGPAGRLLPNQPGQPGYVRNVLVNDASQQPTTPVMAQPVPLVDVTPVRVANPLLERVRMPGQTVRIPSGGIFYTKGELDPTVHNGELHIFPMSTVDEITMKSPDLILSGDAINSVFARCIPGVLKPTELLIKDVDYLLVALRSVTYGSTFDVEWEHTCEDATIQTYPVDISTLLQTAKPFDPTTVHIKTKYELPNKQIVRLRPAARLSDILSVLNELAGVNSESEIEVYKKQRIQSISNLIVAVDEIDDKTMIYEWLENIAVGWFNDISAHIEQLTDWGTSTEYTVVCKDCGEEFKLDVPLNPMAFFM
jgi:hypothetical protein